ncbi:MAG: ADP-ribosylglycohydrolase family protein [bacterium]
MSAVPRADRAAGALLGVHAGDALGATVEFSSRETIRERYPDGLTEIVGGGPFAWPAGHATDDTDLTRAVLLAYLDPGDDVVAAAAAGMLDWLDGRWPGREEGQPPKDVGGATAAGLERYRSSGDPRAAGAGAGRAGNGSLMRCIPTALAVRDRRQRIQESSEISAITHDDERCTTACAAYNEVAAALLDGAPADTAVDAGEATAAELGPATVVDAIRTGREVDLGVMARTGRPRLPDAGGGYVLDSLTLAVAAVLDQRSLRDVLVDVVRVGNDTDTNAAIAGGLLGARDGVAALPEQWVAVLQFGDEFRAAARELARDPSL